mgnify:CR=1 FL=1
MGNSKKQNHSEEQFTSTQNFLYYLHNTIMRINESKIFAGFMIIILNVASRFVTIKLSPSMEAYFKYTFSKQLLIFAIAWMGTRDIYIALIICGLFTVFMDYLFNEECKICVLPEQFTNYHTQLSKQNDELPSSNIITQKTMDVAVSQEEIEQAMTILEKAQKQRQRKNKTLFPQGNSSLSAM